VSDWNWLTKTTVLAIHDVQLSIHGGLPGLRDDALLESALARPRNLAAYGTPDAAELAASYAFGIARNHPFVDGNKRTAFVAAITFLGDNTVMPEFKETDVVLTVLRLAAGEMTEVELTEWFRGNTRPGLHEEPAEFSSRTKKAVKKKPKPRKPAPKRKPNVKRKAKR